MVDTTYSDLVLMIGGQVLFLFILIVITVFGVDPIISPMTNAFSSSSSSSSSSKKNTSLS